MPFVIDLMENKIFRNRYERGLAEGEARGEARGRLEGKLEGKLEALRVQLTKRFGRLPAWARTRLESATGEQLESWLMKVLDARTLEDVLGKR